jgi:Arc/MetJ family transcription regulator
MTSFVGSSAFMVAAVSPNCRAALFAAEHGDQNRIDDELLASAIRELRVSDDQLTSALLGARPAVAEASRQTASGSSTPGERAPDGAGSMGVGVGSARRSSKYSAVAASRGIGASTVERSSLRAMPVPPPVA